jgi:protease-4
MKMDDVRTMANGKVWTGQQAMALKMIDQIGDFQGVVKDTAEAVGIRGEPTLVRSERERKTLLDLLFGDVSEWLPSREKLLEDHIGFYYLWR